MSVVIPVRVPKDLAQKINKLISQGHYSSRSDLIRESLRRFIVSEHALHQKTPTGHIVAELASSIIAWNEKTVTDIILFGSTARGEATPQSDIDLLVLTTDPEPWKIRQHLYDLIYPIIPTFEVDISLIVINKKDFTNMTKNQDPFATTIVKEGKQLQGDILREHNRKSAHAKSP